MKNTVLLLLQIIAFARVASGNFCNNYVSCTKIRNKQVLSTIACSKWHWNTCLLYSQTSELYKGQCLQTKCCQGFTGTTCSTDINECLVHNGGCSNKCVNLHGTYRCECDKGLELKSDGRSCQDINECLILNGGCEERCVNTLGSFNCECSNGFQSDGSCKVGNGTSVVAAKENIFQVHKIARNLLPKGCALLEIMSCGHDGRSHSILLTSTADWYRHKYNNSIHYTYGVVFVETGVVSLPVSIAGLEVVHTASGIKLIFGALPYSESMGEKLSNKRTNDCFFFPITPRDVHTMIASFLPTVFDNLYATLPKWIRFSSSGSTVLLMTNVQTDLIYGKDIETVPECRGAPVYEDHLYNVFRFGSGLKISIFENELNIPSQTAGNKFCFLVDFCNDYAGTMFVLFPPESRGLLQNFDVFKSLYESTGIHIRPRGVALSLAQDIVVKAKTHILTFWNGYKDFTYRISTSANVWLAGDLRWSYEEDSFSISVNTNAELFIAVPDISTLLTGIFVDEWNILLQVNISVTPRLKFKLFNKIVDLHFDGIASAGIDAYVSLGGKEERQICGETANPEGAFVSMFVQLNPFQNVDIMKDWRFDASVKVYAFFTTNPGNISTQNTRINIFTDIVNLSNVIKRFGNLLIGLLHKLQNDLNKILERALNDLQNALYNFTTILSKYLKVLLSEPRQVINALRDIWKWYVTDFKKTYQVVLDTVQFESSYVAFQLKQFLKNETLIIQQNIGKTIDKVRNQLFTVVKNYKGIGFKFSADINIMKLGFGKAEIEFVHSVEKLEQCGRFKKSYDLLKSEKSAKILARVSVAKRLGYFITVNGGTAFSMAFGISSRNFVGHLSLYVTALGLKATGEAFISNDGLIIYVEGNVWDVFVARVQLSTVLGKRWFKSTFNVKGHLGVKRGKREVGWVTDDKDFGGSYLTGISLLIQKTTEAANRRFEDVKKKLSDAQNKLSLAQRKISDAQQKVWSANVAFDRAVRAMNVAKQKLEIAKRPFQKALDTLQKAQRRVDTICRIQSCRSLCVPGFQIRICKKGWFPYPCFRRTDCMFRVPNVPCHLANAGCAVIRGAAYAALEVAKLFVRVPMLALDIAKAAVSVAQVVVDKSRVVLVIANGVLEVAKFGLEAAKGVLEVAKVGLTAVKNIVGAALHVFDMIVQYGLKSLLDVRNCGFEIQLSTTDKAFFDVSCELQAFRLGWHKFEVEFDFRNPILSMIRIAKSTVDTLLEMIKDGIGKRKHREISFKTMTTLHHVVRIYKRDVSKGNESGLFNEFMNESLTETIDSEIFMQTKFSDRIEYFGFNCDSFLRVHAFFSEAVDVLHTMSNESATTIANIEDFKISLQENATNFNITPKSVGINMDYAYEEFNITDDDIRSALQNVSNSPYASVLSKMSNVSSDTIDILDSQLNEAHTISLMDHWILAMTNTTKDYFNETECSGFKDCVVYGFSTLHDLFIDDSIPGVDTSRNVTLDLENIFLELLSNDSWSVVESNNRSIAILRELERINETNIWCSEAPSVLADSTNKTLLYGTSMNISCRVSGEPEPKIRWYLNNTLIENANGNDLKVTDLDHRKRGVYKCEAENIVTNVSSEDIVVNIEECMPGSYFDLDHCELCSIGFYQVGTNQLDCTKCPGGFTTIATGAESASECIDVDECSIDVHVCEHQCENNNGSFTCACKTGYQLLKDGKSCIALESSIYVKVAAAVSGVAIILIISLAVYKMKAKKTSKISAFDGNGNADIVQRTRFRHKFPKPVEAFPPTHK